MSWNAPPPIDTSRTPPSNPVSMLRFWRKLRVAVADVTGKTGESSRSSEIQLGLLTKAAFGAVSVLVFTVTHGLEFAQSIAVVAVQPVGKAGAVTASKFSAQGAARAAQHVKPSVI